MSAAGAPSSGLCPVVAVGGVLPALSAAERLADRKLPGSKKSSDRTILPGGRWTAFNPRHTASTPMAPKGNCRDVIDECLNHVIESSAVTTSDAALSGRINNRSSQFGSRTRVISTRLVRMLDASAQPGEESIRYLSEAGGGAWIGRHLHVITDDEHSLGIFDLDDSGPGRLFRPFESELPLRLKDRKAEKPDL